MVLCTWAYFGFLASLLESKDLLLDDKCIFDIERVTDAVELDFRDAESTDAVPWLLRLSVVSCDPVADDLDDVGVRGKSLIDLRTLIGTDDFVVLDFRPVSLIDNRRGLIDCENACCQKGKSTWVRVNVMFYPRVLSHAIAHTLYISSNSATTLIAAIRALFSDWSKPLVISACTKGSLNVFKSIACANWFSSRTKVSDLPIFVT